jgi:hypothetical protein
MLWPYCWCIRSLKLGMRGDSEVPEIGHEGLRGASNWA